MDSNLETYILLLLSDSNLPTGSFVASSGLESYTKHGFPTSSLSQSRQPTTIINFMRDSLASYAHSALAFVSDAHLAVAQLESDEGVEGTMKILIELDDLYQSMTLNHVARRASTGQGVALLTLYSKGFSVTPNVPDWSTTSAGKGRTTHISKLIDAFKLKIRLEATRGHLPICWGILTAALGLSLERSQYLHLFLHARSLLSAAVRLNDIGPYASQQILLHVARPLVDAEVERCRELRTGLVLVVKGGEGDKSRVGAACSDEAMGPVNTWPLGEILASRHDLQHSRIFNS